MANSVDLTRLLLYRPAQMANSVGSDQTASL